MAMTTANHILLVVISWIAFSKANEIDDILHTGIATEVLVEFVYGGRLHKIFPHVDNKNYTTAETFPRKRFYVTPLLEVQLDSIQYKLLTNKPKLYSIAFQVKIYDDELLEKAKMMVKGHYKDKYEVMYYQMAPYIMPQIGLILRDPEDPIKSKVTIPHRLYPQISQSKTVWFELNTKTEATAKSYVSDMKKNPNLIFGSFLLKFRTTVGTTASKRIKVEVDTFKKTNVIAKINNQLKKDKVFLSSEDMNDLIDQTSRAVRASEYDDNNYIDNNDFISLQEIINSTLTREEVTLKTFNDHRWKSTFWRKEWLKPDVTSTFLRDNVIFNNKTKNVYYMNTSGVDKYTQDDKTRTDMKNVGTKVSTEIAVKDIGITGGGGHMLNKTETNAWLKTHNNTKFRKANRSDLNQLLDAKHSRLEVTGKKFTQHPLKLYRLNTQNVHLKKLFDLSSIQVKETDLIGKMELRVNKERSINLSLIFPFHAPTDTDTFHSLVYVKTLVRYCKDSYGLCLPIWKDEKRENVYYFFPLLKVDTSMIKVECTESSGCFVNFPIIFFDDCYLLRVANFLTHIQKSIVKVKNLQMYPMNKIQLIWAGDPILTDVQLPKPVFLTGNVEAVRNFILPADSREAADHFVKLMQERPWSLTYLQLQYDVIATKTSSKTINVDFGKVAKTDFITSLTNKMHNKSESDYYYIESNDYSQLCREVSQKIVASQITKGFFNISSKNQINLPEILQFYIHDKTFTANDNNEIWKSVFWQNDWTNPDTLRTFLNSQNHTRTGNKQRFRLNNDNVHTYDLKNHANGKFSESVINANGGVKIPGIFETSINVEHNKGSGTEKNQTHTTADNNSVSLTQDQIDSFLDENGNYVKWTGEKFTIKPVKLHRINKGRIDRNETFTIRLTHGESFGIQSTLSLNSVIADMNAECSGLQEPTTSSKATTTHKITTISTTTPSSTTSTTEKPFQFKILLSGGIDPNRPAGFLRLGWKSTEYYFPQRAVQGKLASDMLIERYGHISQLLSNGQVVIAGGRRYALWLCCKRDPKITPFVAETEIFDPAQNTRKKTGKLNGVREFSGSAVIDDVVYICGGFAVCCCCGSGGKTDADKLLENCERYRSGQWQYIKQMSVKRAKFVMVAVKGRLYAIGGYTNTSITGLNGKESNTAEVYNPNTNTWTKIASMHTKRADAAAAVLGNMIYVCGGSDKGCEKYDTELDKWTKDVAPMTTERSLHILVAASGHLFAIGGRASGSNFGGVARTAEMYSPKTNKWVPINPLIEKRWGATAVVI